MPALLTAEACVPGAHLETSTLTEMRIRGGADKQKGSVTSVVTWAANSALVVMKCRIFLHDPLLQALLHMPLITTFSRVSADAEDGPN